MSLETMYTTWCNGQGMLITVRTEDEADKVIASMERFGIGAKVAGRIVETPKDKDPFVSIDVTDVEGKKKYIALS